MQSELRKFTKSGLAEFRQFAVDHYTRTTQLKRTDTYPVIPSELLYDHTHSEKLDIPISIEKREFASKFELGEYLNAKLAPLDDFGGPPPGIWTWLALFYFNELCPVGEDIGREYRYWFNGDFDGRFNGRDSYRHLVYTPVQLVKRYQGEAGRVLLCPEVHVGGEYVEQVLARPALRLSPGVLKVLDVLYFDKKTNDRKPGATTDQTPGGLDRFYGFVNQIGLNYDMRDIDPENLLTLLPPEYTKWISS